MMTIRKSQDRALANHGWLRSQHTFSFADYYDPAHMGFRALRVINEDRISGGTGFGSHPHRDMEILSYVLDGALEHQDSMGNRATITPGEVQRMSAGTGVVHSEENADPARDAHFLQIWILPSEEGLAPGYGQKSFAADLEQKSFVLTASADARDGSIGISQDLDLYIGKWSQPKSMRFDVAADRHVWIQMVGGAIAVNGQALTAGDGLAVSDERALEITSAGDAHFLLFDMA